MPRRLLESLTPREREIAASFAGGATSRQISERLGIGQSTVRAHLCAVYSKLGVSTKVALVRALDPPAIRTEPRREPGPPRVAVIRPRDPQVSDVEFRLVGTITQTVTTILHGQPDIRIVMTASGQPRAALADCAALVRSLRADYVVMPVLSPGTEGSELTLHLIDGTGATRVMLRRTLPTPCPQALVSEAAEAFAAQVAGARGTIAALERQNDLTAASDGYSLYLAAGGLLESDDVTKADTAVLLAERAVALEPSFPNAWLMLNWCRHWRSSSGGAPGDPPEQEAAVFQRAVALSRGDGLALGFLGLARAKANRLREAHRLIEHACELAHGQPDRLADISVGLICVCGEPARALDLIEDAFARCPDPPSAWRYMQIVSLGVV